MYIGILLENYFVACHFEKFKIILVMQFLHLLFSMLFCLRMCGQQMFFGFGTEGVKVS